jgi:hypothetical protein
MSDNTLIIQRVQKMMCTQSVQPNGDKKHNNPISSTIAHVDDFLQSSPGAFVKSVGTKAGFIAAACKVADNSLAWIFVPLKTFSEWCSNTEDLVDLKDSPGSYSNTFDWAVSWVRPSEGEEASKAPVYLVIARKVNTAAMNLIGMWVPVAITASVLHAVKNAPYSKVASDIVGVTSPIFNYLLCALFGTCLMKNSIEAVYHRSEEQNELKALEASQRSLNTFAKDANASEELIGKIFTAAEEAQKSGNLTKEKTQELIKQACTDWKTETNSNVDVERLAKKLENVYSRLEGIVAHRYSKNLATVKAVGNAASLATQNYIVAVGSLAFGAAGRALAPRVTPLVMKTAAPVISRCVSAAPVMAKIGTVAYAMIAPAVRLVEGFTKDIEYIRFSTSRPQRILSAA